MISSDVLLALKPFGLLGLIIVAIVAIVSLVSVLRNVRLGNAAMITLIIAAGLGAILIAAFAFRPTVFWTNVGVVADWGGQDAACEPISHPNKDRCDEERVGQIAVCWDDRNEGWPPGSQFDNCRGHPNWCTYKNRNIHAGVAATGSAPPGRVYVCGRGLVQ
jgi:hypothetical protein